MAITGTITCPTCGYVNLSGAEACEDCLIPLVDVGLPQPRGGFQGRILSDPVSRLDPARPVTVTPDTPVGEVLRRMRQHQIGCVLVTSGNALTGIFTERDVLFRCAEAAFDLARTPVSRVMTADPSALREDDPINFALHAMSVGGFRHMAVVAGGEPHGIISVRDILRYIHQASD